MFPLVGIPQTIANALESYREVFCREAGFEHIKRYLSGLLLSPNKTVQGIYEQWVWSSGKTVSRRAMHEAVFEAGWEREELMRQHRRVVADEHKGRGREVISLDWTFSHHPYSKKIFGAKPAYDYVNHCWSSYQTVVTAAVANGKRVDGIAVEVQQPNYQKEELAYLEMTGREHYEELEQVRERLMELLHYQKNRLGYRKRTEIAVEIVSQIEQEGQFPGVPYAFDQGVLSRPLTELIEQSGKHWVSEVERSRLILWQNQWQRVDSVTEDLKEKSPQSFRYKEVRCRNGQTREIWAFTKVVRLKKYGRKRLTIVHERQDLSDTPRFLLTDALHWDSSRVMQTWSYRWPVETFHQFSKQLAGFESSQLRKEEAVKRHFCLSCIAQSILQQVSGTRRKSERFNWVREHQPSVGQKLYHLTRESVQQLVELIEYLFAQDRSVEQVLEVIMPQ